MSRTALLLICIGGAFGLSAADNQNQSQNQRKNTTVTVLYSGPLVRNGEWVIKAGPPGPDNAKPIAFGGTCSMVQRDVRNGSGFEHIIFEAEKQPLGVWQMTWTDTASGKTLDGNTYTYQQRVTYLGTTIDGNAPNPSREAPDPEVDNTGYSQAVPSNVLADALDVNDIFMIQSADGKVIANSHFRLKWRLQRSPAEQDPPPPAFPRVLMGKYVLSGFEQVSGQAGCDPL